MGNLFVGNQRKSGLKIHYDLDTSHSDYIPLGPQPGVPPPVIPIEGAGDMFKSIYDRDNNGVVDRVDKVLISEVEDLQEKLDEISSPGDKNIVERVTSQTISALKVVSEGDAGIYAADPSSMLSAMSILGITTEAGSIGSVVKVQTGGTIVDPSWSWSQGLIFLAANGTMTQTPPQTGWEIVIGFAPKPTQINLQFDEPVLL